MACRTLNCIAVPAIMAILVQASGCRQSLWEELSPQYTKEAAPLVYKFRNLHPSLQSAWTMWFSAAPARQSTAAKPVVRPCADSWSDSSSNAKKNRPKRPTKKTHQETGACIELAFSTLETQEYLQSYARTQQWKISGEQVTEDSWTFSLELDKDELLRDTTEDSRNKRVEWTGGTVRVRVNSAQLPDAYSRTIVRASFRGYGRSADQFATQKEYWELDSNNNLENSIVSALRSHFTADSSARTPQARLSPGLSLAASPWKTEEWAFTISD